jgi:predicted double-glycine peptidase
VQKEEPRAVTSVDFLGKMISAKTVFVFVAAAGWLLAIGLASGASNKARDNAQVPPYATFYPDVMCGPNCLWQVSRAFGKSHSLGSIAYIAEITPQKGTSIHGMLKALTEMQLPAVAVKTNIRTLRQDPRVAVLLLELEESRHYVILDRIANNTVRLLDGGSLKNLSTNELESIWKGHAILIGENTQHSQAGFRKYAALASLLSSVAILTFAALYALNCSRSLPDHKGASVVRKHSQPS